SSLDQRFSASAGSVAGKPAGFSPAATGAQRQGDASTFAGGESTDRARKTGLAPRSASDTHRRHGAPDRRGAGYPWSSVGSGKERSHSKQSAVTNHPGPWHFEL